MLSHWQLLWEAQQGASSSGKGWHSTAWPVHQGSPLAVLSSRLWQQQENGTVKWRAHARPHQASVWWRSMPCWLVVCLCTDRTSVEWWCWRTTTSGRQEVSQRCTAEPKIHIYIYSNTKTKNPFKLLWSFFIFADLQFHTNTLATVYTFTSTNTNEFIALKYFSLKTIRIYVYVYVFPLPTFENFSFKS